MKKFLLLFCFLAVSAQAQYPVVTKTVTVGSKVFSDTVSFAARTTTPWYIPDKPAKWVELIITSTTADTAYLRQWKAVSKNRRSPYFDSTYNKVPVYQPRYSADVDTNGTIRFFITQDGKYWEAQVFVYAAHWTDAIQIYKSFRRTEIWYMDIHTEPY